MLLYKPVRERLAFMGVSVEVFGIAGFSISDGQCIAHCIVEDVTTDYLPAKTLADLCTENQLELIHLQDVIEDYLNS